MLLLHSTLQRVLKKISTGLLPHRNDLPVFEYFIWPDFLPRKCQRVVEVIHLLQNILKELRDYIKGITCTISQLLSQQSILIAQRL